jgi:hypothetical protein
MELPLYHVQSVLLGLWGLFPRQLQHDQANCAAADGKAYVLPWRPNGRVGQILLRREAKN